MVREVVNLREIQLSGQTEKGYNSERGKKKMSNREARSAMLREINQF